jgi:hypothetical protein
VAQGGAHGVGFSDLGMRIVRQQAETVVNGEALVIHNHPDNPLKWVLASLLGWTPLPSELDRALASRLRNLAEQSCAGFYRFYLVDGGMLREFRLPAWTTIISTLEGRGFPGLGSLLASSCC